MARGKEPQNDDGLGGVHKVMTPLIMGLLFFLVVVAITAVVTAIAAGFPVQKMLATLGTGIAEAHAAGKRARLANVFFNPLWRFVRGYLLRSGFRDGWRGLVFHCVEAGYVRQKYLRLYLLSQAKAPALSVIPTR